MREAIRKSQIFFLALAASAVAATLLLIGPGSEASALERKTCQDNDSSCVAYTGTSWKVVRNGKALGGTYRVSSSKTQGALFAAAGGPDIKFVTATGPKMGKAKVLVMNIANGEVVKSATFDLRSRTARYGVAKTITGLGPDIPYGLVVLSANGRPVAIDAFNHALPPAAIPPHVQAGEAPPPPPPGSSDQNCTPPPDGSQPPPPPGDGELPPPPPC